MKIKPFILVICCIGLLACNDDDSSKKKANNQSSGQTISQSSEQFDTESQLNAGVTEISSESFEMEASLTLNPSSGNILKSSSYEIDNSSIH